MRFYSAFSGVIALAAFLALTSFTGDKTHSSGLKSFLPGDTSDVRKVTIKDQYSLEIGKHMKETKELNDDASLQYEDTEEELYIIVIDESSKEFADAFRGEKGWDNSMTIAENYRRVQMALMKKKMKMKGKPVIRKTKAGSLPMEIVDFSAKVAGIEYEIAYKIGFIEAEGNLYMIMDWTLKSLLDRHNREMEEMITSFRTED